MRQLKVPGSSNAKAMTVQCLIGHEFADDGNHYRFSFLDSAGSERMLDLSLACMRRLLLSLQDIVERRASTREQRPDPEHCRHVASWTAEPCTDSRGVILTFVTSDDDSPIAFQIGESELVTLAEAVVEHELVAYPEGLRFN